jgi:hypothetical protein
MPHREEPLVGAAPRTDDGHTKAKGIRLSAVRAHWHQYN